MPMKCDEMRKVKAIVCSSSPHSKPLCFPIVLFSFVDAEGIAKCMEGKRRAYNKVHDR